MNEPPLQVLGLPADADARAIKLAYARLLKSTRPDEDAAGFQRLNQAYRSALASCQPVAPPAAVTPTAPAPPQAAPPAPIAATPPAPPPAEPQPPASAVRHEAVTPPPLPRFDGPTFVRALYQQLAGPAQPAALRQWLDHQPALWSLQLKQQIGRPLLQQIAHEQPPIAAACFDEVLRFFDLDQVSARIDPLWLASLRRRLDLRWLLMAGQRPALMQRLGPGFKRADVEKMLLWLRRPPGIALSMRAALTKFPAQMFRLLQVLGRPDELPAEHVNPAQLAYWRQLAAPTLNRARLQRWLLRGGIALLATALAIGAMLWIGAQLDDDGRTGARMFSFILGLYVSMTALWRSARFLLPPLLRQLRRLLATLPNRWRRGGHILSLLSAGIALLMGCGDSPRWSLLAGTIALLTSLGQLNLRWPSLSSDRWLSSVVLLVAGGLIPMDNRWGPLLGGMLASVSLTVCAVTWWRQRRQPVKG